MNMVMLVVVVAVAFMGGVEDISGWQFVRSLPVGAAAHGVQTVAAPEPVRAGKTALRFEVRPGDCSAGANNGWDDCASNRERAELKQTGYQHAGETWWYAFSLHVPADFGNIWPAKVAFAQFHQEGAAPAIMIQNDRGGLWLDIHDAGGTVAMLPLLADGDLRGRWHDIVLHVGWSRGTDGFIEAEVDGHPPVIWHGPTMWAADVYFKFGLYRSHLERNAVGRLVTQRVYFDRLRRASSREMLAVSP